MDIEMSNIPVIKELNGIPTLYVEDEPFLRLPPSLFTPASDIYVKYTADVMEAYSYEKNPLFIPEMIFYLEKRLPGMCAEVAAGRTAKAEKNSV